MAQAQAVRAAPQTVHPAVALTAAALPLLGFVLFLLVPYHLSGLDEVTLAEVAGGAHDPKDLWPYPDGGPLASFFQAGAALTVYFGAIVAALGAMLSLHGLATEWRVARRMRKAVWVAGVVSATTLLTLGLTPLGIALWAWQTD
ncbi:MAG: hypothetical protein WBQ50_10615 [Nocardioides sp.]